MRRGDLIRDLVAFTGVVVWAALEGWEARDVVWGLWISSLTVGYSIIVISIVRGARRGTSGTFPWLAVAGGIAMLAFFTVHFGGFHFVHGVFLNGFFPIVGSDAGFPNLFVLVGAALTAFWPLVAGSMLSRFGDLRRASDAERLDGGVGAAYGGVVRMHLLIFVFAGLHMARLSGLAVYATLAAYFFPWGSVFGRRGAALRASSGEPA